jgi:hypothetical protein
MLPEPRGGASGPRSDHLRRPAPRLQTRRQLRDGLQLSAKHYESLTCPSCTRLHFVNRKTGKLLGEKESE